MVTRSGLNTMAATPGIASASAMLRLNQKMRDYATAAVHTTFSASAKK